MLISPAYAQAAGADGGGMLVQLLPLVLIFVVFYFLLIRPQQKKVKQHREMVNNIRRGDKIVTAGGIIATVAKVLNEQEVLVEIAEGVRVRVVRTQVSDVLNRSGPSGEGTTAQPTNNTGEKKSGGFLDKLRGG